MTDPIEEIDTEAPVLRRVLDAAESYLPTLADRPVHDRSAEPLIEELGGPLPTTGEGADAVVERLLRVGTATATHSAGPRFFHFVIGGSTPAALAGDWTASLLDQNAGFRASSVLATATETIALDWLKELFGLPASWGGALVQSATFANFTALACARHWWAARHGVDVSAVGLSGLPAMPVLAGGYVHPSDRKALQMLGLGRDTLEVYAIGTGRIDIDAIDRRLGELGAPAVVIGSAGEVNAGDFDPMDELADVVERHDAWLHVDGAFGMFAALSPKTAHLVAGVDRAHSVVADGHKWLNVPYESGFAFVRDASILGQVFGMPGAPYLPTPDSPRGGYSMLGPESSRRARSLPIWATLAAYGRDGYAAMVERHVALAEHLARLVDEAPEFELIAHGLCIVCFRVRPSGMQESELNALNASLGERLVDDGRVLAGTTTYQGMVAFRPAIVNWRTTETHVELLLDVLRELLRSETR